MSPVEGWCLRMCPFLLVYTAAVFVAGCWIVIYGRAWRASW